MIILALYPGAGETYICSILKEIYGVVIHPYDFGSNIIEDDSIIVTTHLLPEQLPDEFFTRKIIYLVRDGRDCVVSMADFRKNCIDEFSDYDTNLTEAIIASKGSFYGGWSNHIDVWSRKAEIIIKFEELINDPINQIERIRKFMNLPDPDISKYKPYSEMQYGDHLSYEIRQNLLLNHADLPLSKKWEEGMSDNQKEMFYKYHVNGLVKLGYYKVPDFELIDLNMYYNSIRKKLQAQPVDDFKTYKVLIEVTKLQMPFNDGIKRYIIELVKEIKEITYDNPYWQIDVFDGERIFPVNEIDLNFYVNKVNEYVSIIKRIKLFAVNNIKTILKFYLSVEKYQNLGSTYKLFKAKIRYSSINQNFRKIIGFIESEIFARKIKLLHNKVIFDSSKYDLVHIPLLQHVDYIAEAKSKVLMTLHDLTHLTHPQFHLQDNIILADHGLKLCIQNNAGFVAISENTKRDLLHAYPDVRNLEVIYEAAENSKFCMQKSIYWEKHIRVSFGLPEDAKFLLSVSTLEPRKNLKNAIIAFEKVINEIPENCYFIVVGKAGWKMKDVLPASLVLSPKIIFTGFVKEEYLPWLYREAEALIYISYYEGFGLPILESMSCGTPVIYGNNSSMPEIVKNSGYPVDPENVEQIGATIKHVMNNSLELRDKSVQAIKRSNFFTWQKTAILTMEFYRKCIEERTRKYDNLKKETENAFLGL